LVTPSKPTFATIKKLPRASQCAQTRMVRAAQAKCIDVTQLVGRVALAGRDGQIQHARRLVGQQVEETVQFAQRIAGQSGAISLAIRSGTESAFPHRRRAQSSGDKVGTPQQCEVRRVESCVHGSDGSCVSGIRRVLRDRAFDRRASRLACHRKLDRPSAEGLMGSIEKRDRAVTATERGEGKAHDPALPLGRIGGKPRARLPWPEALGSRPLLLRNGLLRVILLNVGQIVSPTAVGSIGSGGQNCRALGADQLLQNANALGVLARHAAMRDLGFRAQGVVGAHQRDLVAGKKIIEVHDMAPAS